MIGIVIGTGPSLSLVADQVRELKAQGKAKLFGINNTFEDFDLDVWIACDEKWHAHYGQVEGDFAKWHWDREICRQYGYLYIRGLRNPDGSVLDGCGLSTGFNCITLGHSSGWQALNLAVHYGCNPILLVGYDMTYRPGEPRHYFTGLSGQAGEYPASLRKWSLFDKPDKTGLLYDYKHIAEQCERGDIPPIYNCSPGSAMTWFPMKDIGDYL